MKAAAAPAKATVSPHRCGRCFAMLVDVKNENGSLRRGCGCVEKLVLVNVVEGHWAVVGSKVAGGKV